MRWKEISTSVCVAAALTCLVTILPVLAESGYDYNWNIVYANNCSVWYDVTGYWQSGDGQPGYYQTEHWALRIAGAPWVFYQNIIVFYDTKWASGSTSRSGDEVFETVTREEMGGKGTTYARSKGYSKFRNPNTQEIFELFGDWITIGRVGPL